ncbi:MAG TPA: RNA polymerase sigma-54 factor, partial [Syntrophomonas sp.]|nr:RNA polymerase sigma-54 factor [Syntrophomonas sp.]
MKLSHDIYLEQQQKLLMTPELRQAIAMLQMSTLELGEYVQNELENNPILEEKDTDESEDNENNEVELPDTTETENKSEEEWLEYYNDRDIGLSVADVEDKSFDSFISKSPSLYDHLQFQLNMTICDRNDLKIGEYIIGSIDANGYLTVGLEELVQSTGADLERVQHMLTIIQSFHPHGVGARDLAECLLIQLEHYGKEDPIAIA